MGNLIDKMPTLKAGEGLLIGDAVIIPSVVQVDMYNPKPASADVQFWQLWKKEWQELDFTKIKNSWGKRLS